MSLSTRVISVATFFWCFFLMRPFKTQVQFFFSDGPCLLCCLGGKCFFIWIDLLSDCRLVVNKVCDIVIESKGKDCGPSTLSAEGSPSTNLFTTFMILHIFWMLLICLWTLCLYGCFIGLRHILEMNYPSRDLCVGSPSHFGELNMSFEFYTTFLHRNPVVWRTLVVNVWFIKHVC